MNGHMKLVVVTEGEGCRGKGEEESGREQKSPKETKKGSLKGSGK